MRRSMTVAAAAVAVAIPAGAAAAGGGSAAQDYVVGGGQNSPPSGFPVNHFAVSAHSDPDGSNPRGEAHFTDTASGPPIRRFNGEVVCLRTSGNQASLVFRFRNTKNQPPTLGGDVMFVEDNGEPHGGVSPDFMTNVRLTPAETAAFESGGCPPPHHPTSPLSRGNVTVRDAP